MAEIPVQKKGGVPWWVWLLLLALVAVLLIWWIADDDEVETAAVDPVATETVAPIVPNDTNAMQVTADGPITDLAMLTGSIDPAWEGRQVQLTRVPVQSVVGDASFWVGTSETSRVYAVLTEERTPNTPIEGEVDIDTGDVVNLAGTIRSGSAPLEGAAMGTPTDPLPQGVERYIIVSSADVVEQ